MASSYVLRSNGLDPQVSVRTGHFGFRSPVTGSVSNPVLASIE